MGRSAATLICVAGVPALVVTLVRWLFDVRISAFRPLLNDEVTFWHQALTFSRAGFHGGYYTLGEVTNPSGFTPFGLHGPGFPVLYGTIGALAGWQRHDIVVLNLIAISTAAAVWVLLSRISTPRLLLSGLLLVTFWPLPYWAPTGMQESLHHAGAILMSSLFAYVLRAAPRTWIVVAGWIALSALGFIRPSWLTLMPLWALATSRERNRPAMIATVAGSVLLSLLIVVAFSRTTAPTKSFFFVSVSDLAPAAQLVWANLRFNVQRTFMPAEYAPLEVLHRVQYWSWLGVAGLTGAVIAWRARRSQAGLTLHLPIAVVAMSIVVVLMFFFYTLTNWAEHRILSAFLLFGALLCCAAPGRTPVLLAVALIASNLASAGVFLNGFETSRRDQFIWDRRGIYELQDALEGHVVYRPGQPRWCNTLLTAQYPPHLVAVPAGIGISVVREPDLVALPLRSHYLLLDAPSLAEFKAPLHTRPLATLPYGTLYENLDSQCK